MTPLKVLTWNTWLQSDPSSNPDPNPKRRAPLIAEHLLSSGRDILCLQKVWRERDVVIASLSKMFRHVSEPINTGPGLNLHSGLLVASRFKLRLLGDIDFTATLGLEGTFANKGAALWEGTWDEVPFQILNVHLQGHVETATHDEISAVRRAQLRQIRQQLLDAHRKHEVPQVICGDFSIAAGTTDYVDLLAILDAADGPITGTIPHTAYGRDTGEFANDIGREFQNQPETLDFVLCRPNGWESIRIVRRVRRFRSPWQSRSGDTYRDLAYRYALEADVWWRDDEQLSQVDDRPTVALWVARDHLFD